MTILVVQCRLASSRLPGKALLPLGLNAEPLVVWTLRAMKRVQADEYWLACDTASYAVLRPLAEKNGWNCFAGPEKDVLRRFCLLVEKTGAANIIRATADNPFLFYEAAKASLAQFLHLGCDYFTYTGLPHGSGVEVLSAEALLRADRETRDLFEREHVGPALYKHPERFSCIMKASPEEWNYPLLRTTVDTPADYRNACRLCRSLENENGFERVPPYAAQDIVRVLQNGKKPVLLVPAVKEGWGTGHFRRCLALASSPKIDADIFTGKAVSDTIKNLLAEALEQKKITRDRILEELPATGEYALVVTDAFCLEKKEIFRLRSLAPLVSLDEGTSFANGIDFLIDTIPPLKRNKPVNVFAPSLLSLPKARSPLFAAENSVSCTGVPVRTVLICMGGEDPAQLSVPALVAFAQVAPEIGVRITALVPPAEKEKLSAFARTAGVELAVSIPDLRSKICFYDLVVTHYGFTAFEAALSGCALILLATSSLHKKLAKAYGCVCLGKKQLSRKKLAFLLMHPERLVPAKLRAALQYNSADANGGTPFGQTGDLASFIAHLLSCKTFSCPLCAAGRRSFHAVDRIVSRDDMKTIRLCSSCGMPYISCLVFAKKEYKHSYFFEEYKAQYGKTYLEDFDAIKEQGIRRMGFIAKLARRSRKQKVRNVPSKKNDTMPSVLDVGCAYGAFLSAASVSGWQPFGIDICAEAIDYVKEKLGFPALHSVFPDFTTDFALCSAPESFDALTMWYVIEHFTDLQSVLLKVSALLKKGGVFAFSTPSASGMSARFSKKDFFKRSPADHFSVWKIGRCRSVLKKYGFKVCKTVSTGHHPERFPYMRINRNNRFVCALSKFFSLGDTFEVYCIKTR